MAHALTIPRLAGMYRGRLHSPARKKGIDWAAAGWAGIAAGVVYILLESALLSMFTGGPTSDAMRQIAQIALSEATLPPRDSFTVLVFMMAMAVHLPLSLLYARILATLIDGMKASTAVAIGAAYGAGLYVINYYAFTGIFPWFAAARGWMTLASHIVFGVVAAEGYVLLTERRTR
ncbi:MAG: hypothetical protein ACHQ49_03190 [Elusimicrobiota bacterium]